MKMILNRNGVHYPLSVSSADGDTLYLRDDIDAIYNDGDILSLGRDDSSKVLAIYKCACVNNRDFFVAHAIKIGSMLLNECVDAGLEQSICVDFARIANEDEKKELFDALEKSGYRWDAETKIVVELKWKPKIGDDYYAPLYTNNKVFSPCCYPWTNSRFDTNLHKKGWCFKTKEECEEFCQKLNKAIMEVKP
jgi:hypothetical protein